MTTVAQDTHVGIIPPMSIALRIAKVRHTATLPRRASVDASGYDLYASDEQAEYEIYPRDRVIIPTGVALELPHGVTALICARSGLAFKNGISVVNGPGIVDSDYRGEVKVCLLNTGDEIVTFKPGDRIAQMLLVRHESCDFIETSVENLAPTKRGDAGFGSTGI